MRFFFQFMFFLSLSVSTATATAADNGRNAYRAAVRSWVISHAKPRLQVISPEANDQAVDLVDNLKFTKLSDMESAKLTAAKLEVSPWSGSYWPTYAGQLANRYGDSAYNPDSVWKNNAEYLEKILGKGKDEELSPAEKYDLLIGDKNFTLTKRMIHAGAPYADHDGIVPTWFGLCHGWAPASFMMPRPELGVTAKTADGRDLYFTPSDLKALATLLWAGGAREIRFIGGRCDEEDPRRDPNHRETNPDCVDTNPATWHLSVVNQIGVAQRSFVLDASAGSEVWNQPVYGYKYEYVNPVTGASSKRLSDAKVKLSDWKKDPYSALRSRGTEYIVKISMSLDYITETTPFVTVEDHPDMDSHYGQSYSYDLELDKDGNILGGEWYSTVHPDFLWVPVKGTQATSVGDSWLERSSDTARWSGREPLPATWRAAASLSSANDQPLARVVNRLYEMVGEGR